MGDSGSWVVRGSTLLGHVFAVQDNTRWCFMIPIKQVVDDIQKSLLTYSFELPNVANKCRASLLCPEAERSHASLMAFGVNFCPSCKQDLGSFRNSQANGSSPRYLCSRRAMVFGDDDESSSSSLESYTSSDHDDDDETFQYVPISGETISAHKYANVESLRKQRGPQIPYVALEVALDDVQPRNDELECSIRADASIVLEFGNPINGNVRTTRVVLITPSLNSALRHVVRWDPAVNQRFRQIMINEPYAVLVRHFHELCHYASELRGMHVAEKSESQDPGTGEYPTSSEPQDRPQHEHVEALVNFTHHFIGTANVASESLRHQRNACTFSKLWLLFHPGMTVYARDDDSKGLAAYIISSVETDPSILRPSWENRMPYIMHLWRLSYDGRYIYRQLCSVGIDYFDDEREITSLKVFPCEYLDRADGGETRRRLEDQGRRWYQLLRGGATRYNGKLPAMPEMVRCWPLNIHVAQYS